MSDKPSPPHKSKTSLYLGLGALGCLGLLAAVVAIVIVVSLARRGGGDGASPASAPGAGKSPTEAEIIAVFETWLRDSTADATKVTLDSPVRTAAPVRRVYPQIGHTMAFPVKVDFTVTHAFPTRTARTRRSGGVYDFYRNSFSDWTFVLGERPQDAFESIPK